MPSLDVLVEPVLNNIFIDPNGDVTIISLELAGKARPGRESIETCVFCPDTRKIQVAPQVIAGSVLEEANRRGVYITDNKHPAVTPQDEALSLAFQKIGAYRVTPANGRHLIMLETPKHDIDPFSSSPATLEHYRNLVWGYIQMLMFLKEQGYYWAGIGKNRNGYIDGVIIPAGSTRDHPHSQAIGLRTHGIPKGQEKRIQTEEDYLSNLRVERDLSKLEGCVRCQRINSMLDVKELNRLILYNDGIHVMYKPLVEEEGIYQESFKILSISHQNDFTDLNQQQFESFVKALHTTMYALGQEHGNIGYNFLLRQGPWITNLGDPRSYHWEFRIYPAYLADPKTWKHFGIIPHMLKASVKEESPLESAERYRKHII